MPPDQNNQAAEIYPVFASKQDLLEQLQDPNYVPANMHEIILRFAATDTSTWADPTYATLFGGT